MSSTPPIAGGAFIGVVGPSGAGKDAVMRFAEQALAGDRRFHFVQRVITRPRDGIGENHRPIGYEAFNLLRSRDRLALHWEAHGHSYGIPIETDALVASGYVVVANLSRTVLSTMTRRYARTAAVEIIAGPEILKARLKSRGRETQDEIDMRLTRLDGVAQLEGAVVIDNSGELEIAGNRFLALLASQFGSPVL